ncbi:hypothetical protein KCP76_09935 [Salmonella enterica subsp. enterica serovar Weltevreden]|nr:hypothetical protein KCP76_09935 [Salmonella enterica subsp. enterica serovar Weltevreden]
MEIVRGAGVYAMSLGMVPLTAIALMGSYSLDKGAPIFIAPPDMRLTRTAAAAEKAARGYLGLAFCAIPPRSRR